MNFLLESEHVLTPLTYVDIVRGRSYKRVAVPGSCINNAGCHIIDRYRLWMARLIMIYILHNVLFEDFGNIKPFFFPRNSIETPRQNGDIA